MKNKRGSVLIITLGFVVAFTLLGMASLHYAMVQNEETERQKASMEAFWLADGAVEQAKAKYPGFIPKEDDPVHLLNSAGETDFNRYYDVHSRIKQDRKFRYEVLAYGKVNGQTRYIKAELDHLNFPDYPFVTTKQPINEPVAPKLVDKIDFFEDEYCDAPIFDGENFDEDFANQFRGTTCVFIDHSQHIKIPAPDTSIDKANILVIDVTEVNKLNSGTFVPVVEFESPINGIVYVKGNLKFLENNLKITGELIVDGQVEFIQGINQNEPEIVYNAQIVDDALILLPQYHSPEFFGNNMKIISWEEVSQLDEQI